MVPEETGDDLTPPDVLIVGGGPAGCAAGMLLARWGHRVRLLTKPSHHTAPLGESIPPSTRKLFDVLGIRASMEEADFVRATGNTVWWGSQTPRVEYFRDGQRGWQVTTNALEAVLRQAMIAAGGEIIETRVQPQTTLPKVAFVLDCSGRSGVHARARHLRISDTPHRTIAMVARWEAATFDLPEPTHTVIESYEGGWAWSVPQSASRRFVAVMVDPRTSDLARSSASASVYLEEIAKARQLHRMLRHATLVDQPRGWDASMYHAHRYVDDNVLLVGDAGSFIDPLSSAGVKKAIASGWLAAVAVNTSLRNPGMRTAALDFFATREQEVFEAFRDMTESQWRAAALGHAHPFWTDRAGDEETAHDTMAIAAAYEQLRQAPDLRLAAHPNVRLEDRAAVSGAEIVLERRLVRDDNLAGARYAYAVDLLTLVQLAPSHTSVPELFAAYCDRVAPVALPDFLGALATAIAHQWLRWCDTN